MPAKPRKRSPNLERYRVPILDRTMDFLELLKHQPQGVNLAFITEALHVPKNTVYRIATTLMLRGYVDRDELTKTYRISRKLLTLGVGATGSLSLLEAGKQSLRALRDLTQETVALVTRSSGQAVILDTMASLQPVTVELPLGRAVPLHGCAAGKAMLAALPKDQRAALVQGTKLTKLTRATITTHRKLANDLAAAQKQGYAVDGVGEMDLSLRGVAAAVTNHGGDVLAALWVCGPAHRLPKAKLKALGLAAKRQAHELASQLGG
jgi:DNA-binding IclR family transcriptional regulator